MTATAEAFQVEERLLATLNGEVAADVKHAHTIARVLSERVRRSRPRPSDQR